MVENRAANDNPAPLDPESILAQARRFMHTGAWALIQAHPEQRSFCLHGPNFVILIQRYSRNPVSS